MDDALTMTKALADGNRIRVVMALSEREELCACQITELLGVTGATASRHLSILTNANLISTRKSGRWVHYRLLRDEKASAALLDWLISSVGPTEANKTDRARLEKIVACNPEDLCREQRNSKCC